MLPGMRFVFFKRAGFTTGCDKVEGLGVGCEDSNSNDTGLRESAGEGCISVYTYDCE